MKDGSVLEHLYEAEVANFKNADKGVEHSNIMAALILKETLQKLYAGEIGFEDTDALDDDNVGIDSLIQYEM
jgi:hypothetical protein